MNVDQSLLRCDDYEREHFKVDIQLVKDSTIADRATITVTPNGTNWLGVTVMLEHLPQVHKAIGDFLLQHSTTGNPRAKVGEDPKEA